MHRPARIAAFALLSLSVVLPLCSYAQPSVAWARYVDGYGKDDVIEDAAIDARGNLYAAGWTRNDSDDTDFYVAMYDAGGTRRWYHLYDNGGNDAATSIAVRGAWLVVTGRSESGAGFGADDDIVTFVLDTAGTIVPDASNAMRYDHGGFGRDDDARTVLFPPAEEAPPLFVSSVHADTVLADTFYVAGTHRDTLHQTDDLLLLMYDGSGLLGSVLHHVDGHEVLAGMECSGGALYLGATTIGAGGFDRSYLTVRYDLGLGFAWQRTYSNNGFDVLLGLAADASGVYVTGTSGSVCGDLDVATVGYAPDGTFLWANRSFDCASFQVASGGVLIDGDDVIAAGYHANGTQYFRIRKSDGTVARMGEKWSVQGAWIGLVRSYDGNVYAGGHLLEFDQPAYATHLAKFDSADQLLWDVQFDGSGVGNPNTVNRMLAGSLDSSVYLVGSVTVKGHEDMMVLKYRVGESMVTGMPDGGPEGPASGLPDRYELDQNYPNPFNSSTVLRYRLPEGGPVSLSVYDLVGRIVARLVEEHAGPGEEAVVFDARDLPSGVYVARLAAGRTTLIRKIVLLK